MHTPKTKKKGKINFMNVPEMHKIRCPFAVVMISMSSGDFLVSLSYVLPLLGTGSQEGSIGTSRKLIIHGLRSLRFCAGAFEWFWYSMMNYHNQMRGKGGKERERARDWKKIQEEFFALTPSGFSVCWWSTVHFSGKHISSLPPTQLSQTESSPSGGVPSCSQSVRALVKHTSS